MITPGTGTPSLPRIAWRRATTMFVATSVVWLLTAGVPQPADAARGSTCTLTPTPSTITRHVDGRPFGVNVPDGLQGPSAPLLIALHGFTQLPAEHEGVTGWSQVAAAQHFIVAYPSAQPERGAWDFSRGSRDVAYLRDLVRDIAGTWCVDQRHVHAEGHSSGALMAARLACDAPDVFASVAVFGGADPTLLGSPCAPGRPISIGIFHGVADLISLFPLAVAHRNNWLLRNGCPLTPATEANIVVEASVYAPCRAGVEVVWRVYQGGHLWPAGADHADITRRMWEFFVRNPLP